MRLYKRAINVDLKDTITLAYFNLDHGRTKLAIDRLNDLSDELGEQPRILYAKGILWSSALGCGVKAFEFYKRAVELHPDYLNALCNAAVYAPNEEEFKTYAQRVSFLSQKEGMALYPTIEKLESGTPYWQVVLDEDDTDDASQCAKIELALQSGTFPEYKELEYRQKRIKLLRKLDLKEQKIRESLGETYPAEERMVLIENFDELDRVINLDPYDAASWNEKAEWCRLLDRNDEALTAANEAIKLRPGGFAQPFYNKALVLEKTGKKEEALECARLALAQGVDPQDGLTKEMIEGLISQLESPVHRVDRAEMVLIMKQVLATAKEVMTPIIGETEDDRMDLKGMVRLIRYRIENLNPSPFDALDYIPAMAQILACLTPESCYFALQQIFTTNEKTYDNCVRAALYIAAHEEAVTQRDAVRLLVLLMFSKIEPDDDIEAVKYFYRYVVRNVSKAADDEMSNLEALVNEELKKIHPDLYRLITDQYASTRQELESAKEDVLDMLIGTPFVIDSNNPTYTIEQWKRENPRNSAQNGMLYTFKAAGLTLILLAIVSAIAKSKGFIIFETIQRSAIIIIACFVVSSIAVRIRTFIK